MFPVCRVEIILDAVVAATRQLLCDFSPLVAHLLVQVKDDSLFVATDRVLHNLGVQVVMPSIIDITRGQTLCFSQLTIPLTSHGIACRCASLFCICPLDVWLRKSTFWFHTRLPVTRWRRPPTARVKKSAGG